MHSGKNILKTLFFISALFWCGQIHAQDSLLMQAQGMWDKNDKVGAYLLLDKALFVLGDSAGWVYGVEKAKLCMKEDRFERAAQLWGMATEYAPSAEDYKEILFLQSYCYLKSGNDAAFVDVLNDIPEADSVKKTMYASLYLLQTGRIDSAQELYERRFGKILSGQFKKCKRKVRKSTTTAMIMSSVLPGLGQVYIGDIKDGVNSLAINAAMVTLTYTTIITYTPLDGVLLMSPWLLRYYVGGIKNLRIKNQQQKSKAIEQLQFTILSNYR